VKAEKFEHIDYFDALLRDGNSRDTAVAASGLHELDERRKPLISINPLFAKVSEMPPAPSVEDVIYEHMSLNLPAIAKNALRELNEDIASAPINNNNKSIEEIPVETSSENPENDIVTKSDLDAKDDRADEQENEPIIEATNTEAGLSEEAEPENEEEAEDENIGEREAEDETADDIEAENQDEDSDTDANLPNNEAAADQVICPTCQAPNAEGSVYCINCGKPISGGGGYYGV
jgi:hypothetical protein